MITASDSYNTVDLGPYYAILPLVEAIASTNIALRWEHRGSRRASRTTAAESDFLSVEQIRSLIATHVGAPD